MESQGLICPICMNYYDQNGHLPRVLPDCGHTICSTCLAAILKKQSNAKCPLDNTMLPSQKPAVNQYHINLALKQLLEGKRSNLCKHHHEEAKLLCYTDKALICADCALFGIHKDHQIEPMKKAQPRLNEKKKTLVNSLNALDGHCESLDNILKDSHALLQKTVKDRFEELRWMLQSKEAELVSRLTYFFNYQEYQVNYLIGRQSLLRKELVLNLDKYKDLTNCNNLFSLIEDDITDLVSKLKGELLAQVTKDIKHSLENILGTLNKSLTNQISTISGFELPLQEWSEKLKLYLQENALQNSIECPDFSTYKFKSVLDLVKDGDLLELSVKNKNYQGVKINPKDFRDVTQIKLVVEKYTFTEGDLNVIFCAMASITNLSKLEIIFSPEGITDEALLRLFPILFWNAQELKVLKINLSNCKIGDQSILFLAERVLPKLTHLQFISLILWKTDISDISIESFVKKNLSLFKSLEGFELYLRETKVTDTTVSQLFVPMPNLKYFCLSLMETSIGDKSLHMLTEKCLPSIKGLETFKIYLFKTRITDHGVAKLFRDLKDVKECVLCLGKTKITNRALELLAKEGLPSMTNLTNFELRLNHNAGITEEGISLLSVPIPGLKKFVLYLDSTEVADNCLKALAKNLLLPLKELEMCEVRLLNTKITDQGAIEILESLVGVNEFTLNLEFTKVSDKFGEAFIRDIKPKMKGLQKFDIKLANTQVSSKVLNQINEMKNAGSALRQMSASKIG